MVGAVITRVLISEFTESDSHTVFSSALLMSRGGVERSVNDTGTYRYYIPYSRVHNMAFENPPTVRYSLQRTVLSCNTVVKGESYRQLLHEIQTFI